MLRITKDTCIIDRLNIQISVTAELWNLDGYETNGEDLPSVLDFQINFAEQSLEQNFLDCTL